MRKYDLYLFDFDGTLVDTFDSLTGVFDYSFRAIGISGYSAALTKEFARRPIVYALDYMGVQTSQIPAFIEAINESLDFEENINSVKFYDEVLDVLIKLKERGAKLGIVSSNNNSHIEKVLKHLKADYLFDVIVGNSDYKNSKPNKEPVEAALRKLGGFDKNKVIYVGDSINDFRSGFNAAVDSYLILRGEETEYDVPVIYSLEELLY